MSMTISGYLVFSGVFFPFWSFAHAAHNPPLFEPPPQPRANRAWETQGEANQFAIARSSRPYARR
jgi:hypothetical protein